MPETELNVMIDTDVASYFLKQDSRAEIFKPYLRNKNIAIMRNQCEKSGIPVNYPDYWVAACALRYNLPLATNNIGHFKHVKGLKLIIPNW